MLREYQQRAIDQLYEWFEAGNAGNPCLVLPTGSGKSHIIAALVKDAIQSWPGTRVLMLTHSKELIAQNAEKMRQHWPNAPMGIYSASLRRYCLTEPIVFAGIQSVAKRGNQIGHIDLCIVDECHSISPTGEGAYRELINGLMAINPDMRVIGLTASPYRLGHGMIHEGDHVLFSDLIEPVSIEELITSGYLSPLRSKHTSLMLSTQGVTKSSGEFVGKSLELAVNTIDNNARAVHETIERARDRKSWIVFCAGVQHSLDVRDMLRDNGIIAEAVTGQTPSAERDRILNDFKAGRIQAVTNCAVLTTGFDAPGIDCVVFLRPTLSPGLYYQMAGRGLRVADGKTDCMVLDFAGNVATHGPITQITPPGRKRKGDGVAPTKTCPNCDEICAANARKCQCGHEFPEPEKIEKTVYLRSDDIMGLEPTELAVTEWHWKKHTSRTSGLEMMMVKYYSGLNGPIIAEYFPTQHENYAGTKARNMVYILSKKAGVTAFDECDIDTTVQQLNQGTPPSMITYKKEGKFFRVVDRVWSATE